MVNTVTHIGVDVAVVVNGSGRRWPDHMDTCLPSISLNSTHTGAQVPPIIYGPNSKLSPLTQGKRK